MSDRMLAFLYARFGPKLLLLIPAWAVLSGFATFAVIGLVGWRYFETDALRMLIACGGWGVFDALIGVPLFRRALRDLGPVLGWGDAPRTSEHAADASRALVHAKQAARRYCWILIALTPLNAITFTVILEQQWWFAFPALLTALTAIGGFTTGLTAVIDVLQQPLRKDVFGHLPSDFEMHERRTPLALQPVALTPIPMLITALIVGAFSDGPSDGVGRFALAAGVGVLLVAGISAVVALRAMAWVAPIKELIAAAKRVQAGDLTASIPVVSSDETGTLAHHFNEMLVGLREREELRTDLVIREAELRASRDRIITAADAERRRVERNLHDGAQQRLVALQLDLRLLEDAAMVADQRELSALAADARQGLQGALHELRDLARGLHPMVLDSDGLAPAIRQLTDRSPLPTTVTVDGGRFPPAIESTLYFVAAEALANVAKHAGASAVTVRVDRVGGDLRLEVSDNGVGGARTSPGSGIGGLADRVDAVGGVLRIVSRRGAGTTIEARIPVDGATAQVAPSPLEGATA